MKEPLALTMRPQKLSEVVGQKHLIGENKILSNLVNNKHLFSMILYGKPGIGKTTIACCIVNELGLRYRMLNATVNNKKDFDVVIEEAKMYGGMVVIMDEIHRLNKDKQDHLLPYIENGLIIIAGCTTANPYHSINPAIRSRCQIVEVKSLDQNDIVKGLKNALVSENGLKQQFQVEEGVLEYIAQLSGGDIRYAYNCLEVCTILSPDSMITLQIVKKALPKANNQYDKDEDQYYDTLSGLQKSIRGSDPNGAMYYLGKLIEANDIESLERRVITTAYEDIGLANPQACMRTVIAFQAAKVIGFPEARIPIASAILDLCLSPKSKSSETAIDAALNSLKKHCYCAPAYLRLTPVGLEEDERYNYNRPELWEYIQYLPDPIKNEQFYIPWMTSSYEKALAGNYRRILKHGRTNQMKKLNKK